MAESGTEIEKNGWMGSSLERERPKNRFHDFKDEIYFSMKFSVYDRTQSHRCVPRESFVEVGGCIYLGLNGEERTGSIKTGGKAFWQTILRSLRTGAGNRKDPL